MLCRMQTKKKTLPTCLAPRSLLCLEETQQARQNLDAAQDRNRLGGSQKIRTIVKSKRLQNTPALPLHMSVCFQERGI